jgi:beta-lactamase class A
LLYPQAITPAECEDTLTWLEQNEINTLLQAGMPENTRVAHKHGWADDTHADVALIYSPGARYVLSVFLYQPDWLVWEESAPTFADIGRLTYLFFNPDAEISRSEE